MPPIPSGATPAFPGTILIDANNDSRLTAALREQIRVANIVVVLAGMYAARSNWIQKEIDLANELKKPMIGIRPWGQERIPQAVQDAAKEMVGWKTDSIVVAIRRWALTPRLARVAHLAEAPRRCAGRARGASC